MASTEEAPFDSIKASGSGAGSVHSNGSADISVRDMRLLKAKEKVLYDPFKYLTETPKSADLLGWFSVACLIVNRMIGTGIFDGATSVLQQDHNIGWSLILWGLGCIASIAGVLMYVEYGLTIPRHKLDEPGKEDVLLARSGGELNYLSYLVQKPPFFAACMFGWSFVLVGTSAANCISFGIHLLLAIGKDASHHNVQHIALGTVTIVCVIHVLGRKVGIFLSNIFATVKVMMLCIIIILGFIVLHNRVIPREPASYANLNIHTSFKHIGSRPVGTRGYASAFLNIIFTFSGWHQANYVLGEIRTPNRRVKWINIRKFKLTAVATVAFISIFFLTLFVRMIVVPIPRGEDFPSNFSVAAEFFHLTIGHRFGGTVATRIVNSFIAASNLGNIIVTTFTFARVHQEIAKEGVVPYALVLQRNVNIVSKILSRKNKDPIEIPGQSPFEPIPVPAILLQCFCNCVLILATWEVNPPENALPLLAGIYSYNIDAIVVVCLGVGILWMRWFSKASNWNEISSTKTKWISILAAIIVILTHGFPIGALWIPESLQELGTCIPWMVIPATGWALIASGFGYWVVFYWVVPQFHSGEEFVVKRTLITIQIEGEEVQVAEVNEQYWQIRPNAVENGNAVPN